MTRPGVSLAATAGLLTLLLLLAGPLQAQAWLPPQGEAFFSFGYANTFITKHYTYSPAHPGGITGSSRGQHRGRPGTHPFPERRRPGRLRLHGPVHRSSSAFPTRRPSGTPGPRATAHRTRFPTGGRSTTGEYHGTLADFRIDALYQVIQGPTVLTPFVSAVIPSHGYQYFAHTAVGRGLHEYVLGLNFGSSLERDRSGPLRPGDVLVCLRGRSLREVETVGNVHHDRSNGALEVGYFITPSIGVRFLAGGFYTHGGLVLPQRGGLSMRAAGSLRRRAIRSSCTTTRSSTHPPSFSAGGLSYAAHRTRWTCMRTTFDTVQGRGGHKIDDGISFGFSWGFSPKQVVRSMFGPRHRRSVRRQSSREGTPVTRARTSADRWRSSPPV